MRNKDLYYKNKYIKEIKAKYFDVQKLLKGGDVNKNILYFYSPDCEICKQHTDLLIEFAILFSHYKFYAINCYDIKSLNDSLCVNLNISKYPTLLYTNGNKFIKFKKNITFKSLEQFLLLN